MNDSPRQTGLGLIPLFAFGALAVVVFLVLGAPGCGGEMGMVVSPTAIPPAAANLYAQATQTAAVAQGTATQSQADRDYVATVDAGWARETAAAIEVTSQAYATSTSDHILAVAAADITRDAAAIIQEVERVGAESTIAAIARQDAADAQEAIRRADRAAFSVKYWKVVMVGTATVFLAAVAGFVAVGLMYWHQNIRGVLTDRKGNPIAIHQKYKQLTRPAGPDTTIIHAPPSAPAPSPDKTARVNGKEEGMLEAPVVLDYGNLRVTFSQRQIGQLRKWVLAGDFGLRRDPSPEGHCFREIGVGSNAYGMTLTVLRGKGYVSTDAPYTWTDRGVREFLRLELSD